MARDLVQSNVPPLLVVANPRAGRGRAAARAAALSTALRAAGIPFGCETTRGPGHARDLAAGAAGTVVAVGGDGTVHEIVDGLRAREGMLGPLAVLPAGSGDDFAANAGFAAAPATLAERLRAGTARTIDVGTVEFDGEHGRVVRRFANVAGLGFDAEVVRQAARSRWLRGRALYLTATLRALQRQRPVGCRATFAGPAGSLAWTGPVLFVATCNGARVGGGLRFAPDAVLDDRQFDVLQVTSASRRATLGHLLRLLRGRHADDPRVRLTRAATIELWPEQPMPLALDGELVAGAVTWLRLQVAAERLRLVGTAP
ncbi:MAG: hypothetical protein JNL08_21550 [Planctomycetes bacterium]|nr:hypothetical protein [Planctomycetota bacterium]